MERSKRLMSEDRKPRRRVGVNEPVEVGKVQLVELREKAMRVRFSQGGRMLWVPLSQVHDDSELYGIDTEGRRQLEGAEGKLVLKRGFAEDNLLCRK